MLPLPILNVHLHPCHEDWQQMTPTAQGRHCAACQRTVVDFTAASQADLEAARLASPDGRLCGRFRAEQLARPPRLRPRLRRFVVALVLVCGLGLTSQQAWAQVRQVSRSAACSAPNELVITSPEAMNPVTLTESLAPLLAPVDIVPAQQLVFGMVSETMPVYKNGGQDGLVKFIKANLQYPTSSMPQGKVFLRFVVTKTGKAENIHILKGLDPAADAEALRVLRLMGPWIPGEQQGRPVDVGYVVPITFSPE